MATIAGSINHLRRRFLRLKRDRGLIPLQYEIGVSIGTLQGFLRGKNITVASLEAIEAWCERQERARARARES